MSRESSARLLVLLFALFVLRVIGQALVGFGLAPFLPAWHAWYSGLLPYPGLLASQLLIIAVFGTICVHVARGRGYFARPHQRLGSPLVIFGAIYALAMVARYAILRTHEIPVIFHIVLAGFILTYGAHQRRIGASPQRRV